jgi:hypothetical protein
MSEEGKTAERPGLSIRSPQDFAAGLFLVAVAGFAIWQASDLPLGTLRAMGPGMLPRAVALMVAAGGVMLIILSFVQRGPALERVHWRGPFFILGGIILFALTIRTLGLLLAGPIAMFFGSMASDEFRWKESIVFALALTGLCIVLFKFILGLPIPVVAFM